MAPSDREFDFLAERLSENLSTIEHQLMELGASVFSSAQLIEMRGRFRERLENFEFFQKKLTLLAVWSPACLAIGAGGLWLGFYRLGPLALFAFPIVLMICLGGIFSLYQNFGSQGKMEHYLELVEEELKKRKMKR